MHEAVIRELGAHIIRVIFAGVENGGEPERNLNKWHRDDGGNGIPPDDGANGNNLMTVLIEMPGLDS
jgi:hypothetical protein